MANKPVKFHSLSRRIIAQFCIFTLALSAVYGLICFILMYTLEDSFIERDIKQEASYLASKYQQTGQWPVVRSSYMQLHFSMQSFPEKLREKLIEEPRRKEFYGENDRHYHLYALPDHKDVYLIAEVSQELLVRPIRDGVIKFLLISGLTVTLIACLIAWLIGRNTARPLKQLADLVDGVAPENIPKTFAHHFPNNEIGILATTLEQTMRRISQALEREKCFTRDVSHELRTPLAVIKNAVEVHGISKQMPNEKLPVINRISQAAMEMEKTVTTLLILAREEHTSTKKEAINLMSVIEQSVLDNRYLLGEKNIDIDINDNCSAQVIAQPGMLKVLLDNLLSNAFQYTESGQVTVDYKDNCLTVEDTGPGIETEISDRITQPAVKGSQSTGYGFGMSIVKRLCEHQNWQLNIQGLQGTAISVTFTV